MSQELESGAVALLDAIAGENAQKDTSMDNGQVEMESGQGSTKDDPRFIHMPLTPELLAAARLKAGENVALGPWLQEYLAAQLGVTLPVKIDKRVRYTGPDADKLRAAAKVKATEKAANLRKGLLMVHRARAAGDMVKLAEGEKLIADNS